jgi:hypothetical protein
MYFDTSFLAKRFESTIDLVDCEGCPVGICNERPDVRVSEVLAPALGKP